jgi:hypothetical protein
MIEQQLPLKPAEKRLRAESKSENRRKDQGTSNTLSFSAPDIHLTNSAKWKEL